MEAPQVQVQPDDVRAVGMFADCPFGGDAAAIARVLGFGSEFPTFDEFEKALKTLVGSTQPSNLANILIATMSAGNNALPEDSRVSLMKITMWGGTLDTFLTRRFRANDEQQHTGGKSTVSKRAYDVRRSAPASGESGSQTASYEDMLLTLPELLSVWEAEGYEAAVLRRNGVGHLPEEE